MEGQVTDKLNENIDEETPNHSTGFESFNHLRVKIELPEKFSFRMECWCWTGAVLVSKI